MVPASPRRKPGSRAAGTTDGETLDTGLRRYDAGRGMLLVGNIAADSTTLTGPTRAQLPGGKLGIAAATIGPVPTLRTRRARPPSPGSSPRGRAQLSSDC